MTECPTHKLTTEVTLRCNIRNAKNFQPRKHFCDPSVPNMEMIHVLMNNSRFQHKLTSWSAQGTSTLQYLHFCCFIFIESVLKGEKILKRKSMVKNMLDSETLLECSCFYNFLLNWKLFLLSCCFTAVCLFSISSTTVIWKTNKLDVSVQTAANSKR